MMQQPARLFFQRTKIEPDAAALSAYRSARQGRILATGHAKARHSPLRRALTNAARSAAGLALQGAQLVAVQIAALRAALTALPGPQSLTGAPVKGAGRALGVVSQ